MLEILKLKLKKSYTIINNTKNLKINSYLLPKSPNVRNWENSVYGYNRNTLSIVPEASKLALKLIKSFFILYNLKLERKSRLKRKKKYIYKRFSSNKIFLSEGQFKHTNDLVNITIFFYNKQLLNYKKKITRRYKKIFKKFILKKKLKLIKKIGLNILYRYRYIKYYMNKTKIIKNKVISYEEFYTLCYKRFIKKSFYKIFVYMYLRQIIFINEFKFNNYYLHALTNLLKKIYKKNIIFNFINVKYHYYNSNIFTESLLLKIRKDKRKVLKYLKRSLLMSKVKKIEFNPIIKYALNLKLIDLKKNKDTTNNLLYNLMLQNKIKSNYLKEIVLSNIKYKKVSGIRLQIGGRLSKRNIASRSISKNEIKGNLINFNSSKKKLSTPLLRGNFKSNLEYTNLNSKVKTGTFGIKGWISGD